ncbi:MULTISPECIES: hypothetical protein [unclassified Bradyrhizobium]|uniref:hypothetical protein n=1 Tax=unclassified Bradyrhizobium TaxID=2631580 RepID=UPI0012E378FA|nr:MULTISPECIES: hypothetical protein [unclassified Bradyrhizobium]
MIVERRSTRAGLHLPSVKNETSTEFPNGWQAEFLNAREIRPEQGCFHTKISALALAGAGGIEPPNGGIKIRLIILLFQDVFGKMDEIRSSNFNTLAAVSK